MATAGVGYSLPSISKASAALTPSIRPFAVSRTRVLSADSPGACTITLSSIRCSAPWPPSADAIARALVGRDAIRLQPSGAYAANVLGLSEQVPARVVFLTDGPARKVKIGKQEIILQQTTPRNMAAAGRKSGTLIQALRYLGQDQVDEKVGAILRRQIAAKDRAAIRRDLRHAPAWIADFLLSLMAPAT